MPKEPQTKMDIQSVALSANPTAKDFQDLAKGFVHAKAIEHIKNVDEMAGKRKQQIDELSHHHIDDTAWQAILYQAREAAQAGSKEYMALRFPNDLCSDGGRAINVVEAGWPETLQGEAAEIYARWQQELKSQGFRLFARTLEYPEGFPGDIGLFLGWEY